MQKSNFTVMTNQDIIDNIEGSVKKKQYLEAFLLQSTYLEGIVRMYASAGFEVFFTGKVEAGKATETEKNIAEKTKKYIENEVSGYNFDKTISFLRQTEIVEKTTIEKLSSYKTMRNKIVHRLVAEASGADFDKNLEDACKLGQEILENSKFQIIIKAVIRAETQPPKPAVQA